MLIFNSIISGLNYERSFGVCHGYGMKSFRELLISEFEEKESVRDIPQCSETAGVLPCHVVDFSNVSTGRQFVERFELIGNSHLQDCG